MTTIAIPTIDNVAMPWLLLAAAIGCRLVARRYGHPFTAIGRAKMARHRRLRLRVAELIARGMPERDARRVAESDVTNLAMALTYELRLQRAES